jgi:hypothetical protein
MYNRVLEPPPDLVRGSYTNDLNIFKIHEAIITRFNFFKSIVPDLQKEVNELKTKLEKEEKILNLNDIRQIKSEIKEFMTKIDDYDNEKSKKEYESKVLALLEEYKKVASNSSKGLVIFKKKVEEDSREKINYRLKIIRDYIEAAKDYIRLEITHKVPVKAICPICETDLSKTFIDDYLGLCTCPTCGYERESISHHSTFKDSQRVNIGNRNNYDDCENFRKVLMRFQGKQPNRPPPKLYEQLDEYFKKIGKNIGDEFRALPLTPEGRKKGTSRQMMFEALGETNNSAYYDDINLIMHNYWGWELPDISELEDKIMEDYMTTQQVYNAIPNKDRNASLNIQFRLYVHLKAIGYPCSKEDFKIQTSRDSLEFHQEMWKIMCEKTGLKFHPVI